MKKNILVPVVFFVFLNAFNQQDPQAKKILDNAAEKMKNHKTIQANFKLTINDRKEGTDSKSEGKVKTKGEKYYFDNQGTKVFFDGKTMWTYVKEYEEVTITEPDLNDEDFISNPAKILNWYNRDFKYRYVGENIVNGKTMHEIDLFPNDLNQPFSRIKFYIGKEDLLLYMLKSVGKEGIDYTIDLSNYVLDAELSEKEFMFNKENFKKVEIIDMRLN